MGEARRGLHGHRPPRGPLTNRPRHAGRPVTVRLAPGDDGTAIADAAARIGASLSVRSAALPPTTVGSVGLPPDAEAWRVEALLVRALRPAHVLFLCVANSARSQLAEAIARSLAPDGVCVSSAGSAPASVRPQAVEVLEEIGIDASGLRSKGVEEVEGTVDAVVTLCAEEVCPVWLGDATRVHWALADPAAAAGTAEETLDAFRSVRDELRERLATLLSAEAPADG